MKKYICTSIQYDTDKEEIQGLPEAITVIVDNGLTDDDLEETLRDAISDETGWCVNNFIYEEIVAG
jgi:folate-dependent tRNA-U54 methylase TrmFO/GidA